MSGSCLADGVYTVAPTPFDEKGDLDLASLERLIGFLADRGVQGLLVLGVLGEAPKLRADERAAVVETTMRAANGRCPVIFGATHPSVAGTRALARAAQAAGAAGVLISPPRLDRAAGANALVEYFRACGDGLDIEIVLQDHPASSGVALAPELIAQIAAGAPQVQSIKLEDPPTPAKVTTIRALLPETFKVFGGLGGVFFLEELDRGAHGTMTGFAFPELLVEVHQLHAAGEEERAAETFYRYLPLIRFEFQEAIGLAIRKHTYMLRGAIDCAHVREPAVALDSGSIGELERLLERVGLTTSTTTER